MLLPTRAVGQARTVKYEEVHLKAYDDGAIAKRELGA